LEGDPWLSSSNETVSEEHNLSSKDRSKTAKDRRAKAETNFLAQLHRSLSALDFEYSDMADRNDVQGKEKENRCCRQLETLRMYQSAPDLSRKESDSMSLGLQGSATDQKRRAKKLAEKRLVDAVDAAKVSLSGGSSNRSLQLDNGINSRV
jgi:hypothetical protein